MYLCKEPLKPRGNTLFVCKLLKPLYYSVFQPCCARCVSVLNSSAILLSVICTKSERFAALCAGHLAFEWANSKNQEVNDISLAPGLFARCIHTSPTLVCLLGPFLYLPAPPFPPRPSPGLHISFSALGLPRCRALTCGSKFRPTLKPPESHEDSTHEMGDTRVPNGAPKL